MYIWCETYRYWQGDDEDPTQRAQATGQLAQEGLGLDVVAHRRQGHQTPPDAVVEGPVLVAVR